VVGTLAERTFGAARWIVLPGSRNPPRRLVGPAIVLAGAVVLTDIHGPTILVGAFFVPFARNRRTIDG
jgi:hypothetical protein